MDLDDIRRHLYHAATLRMPRFDDRDTTGMRVEKLEDYLMKIAITRGDLEEGRLFVQQALRKFQLEWEAMEGWETHLPTGAKTRTQADIRAAKRKVDQAVYDGLEECRWLIARLTEQINRLSHMGDDQVASRVYTLLAGN